MRLLPSAAVLAMACSCSPGAKAPARESANDDRPRALAAPQSPPSETARNDRPKAAEAPPRQAAADVRRCGWLQNPTPGNWWLIDRDGEWILGTQGGYQAPGLDEMPDMSAGEWVARNGSYGYGCACMTIRTDPASRQVLQVSAAAPRPLAQCRADRKLPKPDAD